MQRNQELSDKEDLPVLKEEWSRNPLVRAARTVPLESSDLEAVSSAVRPRASASLTYCNTVSLCSVNVVASS
ncbi:hypothetical protein BHE74_00011500 [Ensete ventricosum]|uniref:Uncharacterized protein n=1 Tax=Ensete ventricosum TaxID=4639 RepID=A0A444FFR5_ENSVE|nr:hypothetical protein B296_00017067 [Ensete ventricosum]RWW21474.1 hypothetical protein GW17_00014373 [Ensete ventricosum]RWW80172.1 hypothetical protein BHE74_00011500 [Ensete ventricosum]RZR77008.1 hypothetical protein BHM03_00001956 [Ensete ventricosum]